MCSNKDGSIDFKKIYDKLNNAKNGEVFYTIGFDKKIYSHTSAFVYGKLDDKLFIMYFNYPKEGMYILNSKIANDKKITKIVLPTIQHDNSSCFMFQTKMLQTMSPKVILDIIKDKRFACNTETIYDIRKPNYYTYGVNCPYIDVGTEQLPQDLLSYMQSISKIKQLNNGDDILKKNKDKGYIKSSYNIIFTGHCPKNNRKGNKCKTI